MRNLFKIKIVKNAYETVVLWPKQKRENKKISLEIGIFDFYANFCWPRSKFFFTEKKLSSRAIDYKKNFLKNLMIR